MLLFEFGALLPAVDGLFVRIENEDWFVTTWIVDSLPWG
jgi:hypothetical protein